MDSARAPGHQAGLAAFARSPTLRGTPAPRGAPLREIGPTTPVRPRCALARPVEIAPALIALDPGASARGIIPSSAPIRRNRSHGIYRRLPFKSLSSRMC
jgi:hypothetical protein